MTEARTLSPHILQGVNMWTPNLPFCHLTFEVWFFVFDYLTIAQPKETFGAAGKIVWCFS